MEQPPRASPRQRQAITRFWAWFIEHAAQFSRLDTAEHALCDELLRRLKQIERWLSFEFCANARPHHLIITAGGQQKHFPLVDEIVAASPPVDGWVITALKPASGFDFVMNYEGLEFDPRTLWFLPLERESDHSFGMRVGIPSFDPDDELAAKTALWLMLETALGERTTATEVEHLEVTELPAAPATAGYIELTELAEYLAWRRNR